MYRSGWISANGVPTCVRTWGGWIGERIDNENVLICITGNPGVTDFYIQFLSTLYHLITRTTVWVVSHAGHQIPSDDEKLSLPSLDKHPELYNLEGQVRQKKEFIEKYLPPNKNLYLIGHSVGGKICAELLKDDLIASRVKQAHLICPTLENIAETRNGKFFRSLSERFISRTLTFARCFSVLPYFVRYILVSTTYILRLKFGKPSSIIRGYIELFHPKPARASLFLGSDEMSTIVDLDHEVYEKHGDKITAYYAQTDGWAPLEYLDRLKKSHPNVETVVLNKSYKHAFVIDSAVEMATLLSERLNTSINSN